MKKTGFSSKARAWAAAAVGLIGITVVAIGCSGGDHAPATAGGVGCVDKDNDGFGTGCFAGADCNDNDPTITVCGTESACVANAYAPGCACTDDGATHDCGEVTGKSDGYVVCGYGSVRCAGGVWGRCQIDANQSGLLSVSKPATLSQSRILALGAATPCTNDPCDPFCKVFRDTPDPTILHDGGRGGPPGAIDFVDASMSTQPTGTYYPPVGPRPDAAPSPSPPPVPTLANIVVTSITCPPTVERGSTLTCTVTINDTGDTFAPTFANDLRLSTDTTITTGDVLLDYCGVSELAGLGSVTLTCSGTVPSTTADGAYNAGIIADSSGTVPESNETDNTASTPVQVVDPTIPPPPPPPPAADLQISAITCTTPVDDLDTLSCTVTVQNTGGTFAPVFSNGLYLSTDTTIDSGDTELGDCDVSTLAPGTSATVTCSGTVPVSVVPGPYTAGVIVDTGNSVPETDETNNTAGVPVTIGASPPPPTAADITVTAMTCAPGTFAAGGTVACSVTLANAGGTWAGNFVNDLRLSTDATITNTDTLLGNCSAPALGIGGTVTVTCAGTIPLVTAPGSFFAGLIADSGNAIVESNEANNTASVAVTVTATPPAATPPDISVTTVACQPTVAQGGTLSCAVTLSNSGGFWTGAFANELRLSTDTTIDGTDTLLGNCDTDGILAGSTVVVNCTGTVPLLTTAGTWYAGIIADSGNAVAESNEANNTGSAAFTVAAPTTAAAPPDLIVTAVSCPASVSQSGALACAVTIKNQGGVAASGFTNDLRLSTNTIIDSTDLLLGTCGVSYVAAGASTVVTCSATIPAATATGAWRIGVIADSGNAVLESDENNNTASTPITVTALPAPGTLPNITVTSVTCGAPSYNSGDTASCTVVLSNPGGTWTGPFTNELRLSTDTTITNADTLLGTCSVTGMDPAGGTATVTCTGTISLVTAAGTYYVGLIADSTNAVVESNEADNTGVSTAITVTAPSVAVSPPDIVVTAVTCPASVNRTEVLACSITFKNNGGTDAGTFVNDLRLSTDTTITSADTLLTSACSVSYLAAGASTTVTCAATVPNAIAAGSYFAGVIADSGNAILESNEANNTADVAVAVTNPTGSVTPADLIVTALACAPGTFQSGATLPCQVTVKNQGGTWAGGFEYQLVLSSDATIATPPDTLVATCSIPFLAVGASSAVTCSGTIPAATAAAGWNAGIILDSGNVIAEGAAGEANNTSSTAVTVTTPPVAPTPPDLAVTAIVCPGTVREGDTLSCSVTFKNSGGSAAGAFTNQFVLASAGTAAAVTAGTVLSNCGMGGLAAGASSTVSCSGVISAATPVGTWYAGVITDSGNAVVESNEANNTLAPTAFGVTGAPAAATADLQVTSVTNCALAPSATPSSELSCDVKFTNSGTLSVGPFTNQFILAVGTTPAAIAAGTLLGNCGVDSLAAGSNTTVKCSGTVPAAAPTGTYYAGVIADSTNAIAESNETNNTGASAGFVLSAAPSTPLPDLVVTSVTCPSTYAGATISCLVGLKNQGANWAGAFTNTLWLSTNAGPAPGGTDVSIGTCTSSGLSGGATASITCTGTIPAAATVGTSYIKVVADSGSVVTEASESNNDTSGSFAVVAAPASQKPDLIVQAVSCTSATFTSGGSLSCALTIVNQGSVAAGAFTNALRISPNTTIDATDLLVATCNVASLGPNASTTATCTGTVPPVGGTTNTVTFVQSATNVTATVGSTAGFLAGMTVLVGGTAATKTTASFSQPIVLVGSVTVNVGSSAGFTVGQKVYVAGGGTYTVASIPNGTQLNLANTGVLGNVAVGTAIGSASVVTAGSYYTVASIGSATSVTLTNTGASTNIPTGLLVPAGQTIALNGFYFVGGIADSANAITESDETNNTGITLDGAGPSATSFVLSPGNSTTGQATNPPLTTQTNTIEVFFLLDVSGTMGNALSNLRTSMIGVMNDITGGFTTTVAPITTYPAIATAKFGVGHFVGYNQSPYNQNTPSAAYQAPLPFWTATTPSGTAAPPVLGAPLLPVQSSTGVTATSNQVTNSILPFDTSFPCASCVSRAPNNDEPEFWTAGAFAEMNASGGLWKSGAYTAAGSFWVPPRALAGYSCPANTNGYPCFDNASTPITVIFSDNPSAQGPGGLFAYPHPATDAASGSVSAFSATYAPVTGAPPSAAATCVNSGCGLGSNNYTEGTAYAIDPTKFERFRGKFSTTSSTRPAYYTSTRDFPTSYGDWNDQYGGTAQNLCATAATGGEAWFSFTLAKRSFVHFDTFGSATDTQLYVIDRTASHADSNGKIVDCQDYQHWLYLNTSPQGHIYKTWSGGTAAPTNNTGWTAGSADIADMNSYLDAGTYSLAVVRKTGTTGSFYLAVNADPEKGTQPISPATAPNTYPTLPTFDQMIAAHQAAGGAIVGVDVSGMGPVNSAGTAFTHCASNYKQGHRTDRFTYVTMQEAARQTGACRSDPTTCQDPTSASYWTDPYVFSVDMDGGKCQSSDAPLAESISNSILDLTNNNLRQDVGIRVYDFDDATDFDGTGGSPTLSPNNCDEGPNGVCDGATWDGTTQQARPYGIFVNAITPVANTRCTGVSGTTLTGCLPGTGVSYNISYGVPGAGGGFPGFTQLCNDQIFKFQIEAYVKTATCTPGTDCYSLGTTTASVTVPGDPSKCATNTAADLTATVVSCNSPLVGDTLSCSVTFSNSGSVATPAFTSQLVLSSDTTIATPVDAVLGTCVVDTVPAAVGAVPGTATVTCSGPATSVGSWNAGIIADSGNTVTESNETNNTASLPVVIGAAPTTPTAADLSVLSMTCASPVSQGGTQTCNVTLQNTGGTDVGAFTNALVLANGSSSAAVNAGTAIGTCGVNYLAAGGTTTVVCSGQVPSGTAAGGWYAGLIVNVGNVQTESTYANNTAASAFSVTATSTPKADLVVDPAATLCTASVAQAGTLTCAVTVKNQGGTWAGAFTNQLVISTGAIAVPPATVLATCTSAGIAAGSSAVITCAGSVPNAPGGYSAGIILDSGNAITESDETNNTYSSALAVTADPAAPSASDIVVQTVDCSASSPVVQGGTLSCAVTFKNAGQIDAPGFTNKLVLAASGTAAGVNAGATLGTCGVSYLAAGTTTTVTCAGEIPSATPTAGPWFGGIIADSGNVVIESNENNNTGATSISVTASGTASGADLVVTAVSCPPATFAQGSTMSCSVTVQNTGGVGISTAFTNKLVLASAGTNAGVNAGTVLGTCGISSLAAGASTTITCAGVIPVGTPTAGPWFAGAIADSANDVPEANEANNTGATSIAVTATSTSPAPADLVVQSVTCPATVAQGGTLDCTIVLKNQGGDAAGTFANDLRLSSDAVITTADTLLKGCGVSYLAAGASVTLDCSAVVPTATALGGWYAGVIADSGNLILESDETNNTGSAAFVVTTPPTSTPADIQVQSVVCPATVAQGATLSCTATLTNAGGTAAGAFANELRLSSNTTIDGTDLLLGNCGLSNLAAAGTVAVTCSGTIPTGTVVGPWYAGVIADSGGAIPESNEANNTGSAALAVTALVAAPPPPDLFVTSVVCPATVAQGTDVSCAVTITNFGGSDAGVFTNDLRLSPDATITAADLLLTGCGVGYLAAGTSTTISCAGLVPATTALSPPTWYVGVIADSSNLVLESNELNNTASSVVSVIAPSTGPTKADITVQTVTCPAGVQAGATLSCDVTFANTGGTPAGAFSDELRLSPNAVVNTADAVLGNCGVTGIAAGATATVTCAGVVPAGTTVGPWHAGIVADSTNVIVESNETNNTNSAPFAVSAAATPPPLPDIFVSGVVCPATVGQGGTLACSVTFTNQGSTVATAFSDELWLSLDTTINGADALIGNCGVSGLGIGASVTVTCAGTVPVGAAAGPWYAGIVADSTNAVAESDETNNVATSAFAVTTKPATPPPLIADIQVTSVTCPANVDQGGTLTCTVVLTNNGGSVAGAFDNELRLSSDATITSADTLLGDCGVSGLAVGTPTTVTCSGMVGASTPTGSWFAGVIADSTNAVVEQSETNNTASAPVTINTPTAPPPPPNPDLVITSMTCPGTANPGDPLGCTVTAMNQGGSPAGASALDLRWSIDKVIDGTDTTLGTCPVGALAAGASTVVTCNVTVPTTAAIGLYWFVGGVVDPANAVAESDENNNTSYTAVLIPAPAAKYGDAWYERDYNGTNLCASGYSPVWGLFSWESATPSDSHITFAVQTADTQAGLDSAPTNNMATAARATAATPPGYGGTLFPAPTGTSDTQIDSVIVNDVLQGTNQSTMSNWLRVTFTLDVSSDQLSSPSLSKWGLVVSCSASR